MNAYQVMVFLLLFNLSLSIVISLDLYITESSPSDENLSIDELKEVQKPDLLNVFGGNVLGSLVVGTVVGGALSIFTGIPGDAAFAYSYFVSFYWGFAKNTLDILYSLLLESGSNTGLNFIVIVFVTILGIAFLSFLIQLVRGPWATMR